SSLVYLFLFFFFQAEDGIRDFHVTGVQTCALPIFHDRERAVSEQRRRHQRIAGAQDPPHEGAERHDREGTYGEDARIAPAPRAEIGRASCRERVESAGATGTVKKKRRRERDTTIDN